MPHPKHGYRLKDGTKVPSVTTILSCFKDCGGLIAWANNLGLQGIDHRDVRDKAADAGTMTHSMIEKWARGEDPSEVIGPEAEMKSARTAFAAFLRWADSTRFKIIEQEVSLVSERHRFAGCLDSTMAVEVNGALSLGDWKTSNSVYADYLFQLAGYAILWEENFHDRPLTGGFHLLRFSKDYPDFSHRSWPELDDAKRGFLMMRELYDIKKRLEARAK